MTGDLVHREPLGKVIAVLFVAIPFLLAAELSQRSRSINHLPDRDAYRSDFSDRALMSSKWRQPTLESPDWRAPASPKIEWRTDSTIKSQRVEKPRNLELYPDYSPGGTSTFDLSTREDESLIKVFEFDFGK